MILILQILVSVIFFTQKVLVLVDKRAGWLVGAVAAMLAIFYFALLELYVYTALEFGLVALMVYGFCKKKHARPRVEMWIRALTVTTMCILGYFAWDGLITGAELCSSLGLLWGTFFLTHHKPRTGWMLSVVGHGFGAYLGHCKDQQFFMDFQIASLVVSVVGVMKVSNTKTLS